MQTRQLLIDFQKYLMSEYPQTTWISLLVVHDYGHEYGQIGLVSFRRE